MLLFAAAAAAPALDGLKTTARVVEGQRVVVLRATRKEYLLDDLAAARVHPLWMRGASRVCPFL